MKPRLKLYWRVPNECFPKFIYRGAFKDLQRKREELIGGEPRPDDHPLVVELRRRLVGLLEESADCNLF